MLNAPVCSSRWGDGVHRGVDLCSGDADEAAGPPPVSGRKEAGDAHQERFFEFKAGKQQDAVERCLQGLNRWLAEPVEGCLASARDGAPCLEAKSPIDLELELGHYRGNIFHTALSFPFTETQQTSGSWGVETEFENVFYCGASARRGGGVSGIPGHNASMKVLECMGLKRR